MINKLCYKVIAMQPSLQLVKTSLLLHIAIFSLSIESSAFTAQAKGTNRNYLSCA